MQKIKFVYPSLRISSPFFSFAKRVIGILLIGTVVGGNLGLNSLAYADLEVSLDGSANSENPPRTAQQAFTIMQRQLAAYAENLGKSERLLQDFQQKHGIISIDTQINLLLQQRKSLDGALKEAQNRSKGFKEKLAWVEDQISQVPREIPLSSGSREQSIIGGAKNKLLGLQLEEQELLNKYTEKNPHVISIRKEMELIKSFIKEHEATLAVNVTTGKNPVYAEMEMQLFHTRADLISAEAQAKGILETDCRCRPRA